MLKNIFFIPLLITPVFCQMVTSSGTSAFTLVQNSMAGYGVDILWVTSQGGPTSFGPFTGTGSTIGFEDGIVLTTGSVMWAHGPTGPNDSPDAGIDNGAGGYTLLNGLIPSSSLFNVTAFEISFIPSGDSIFFEFVFGSEEYKEYVGAESSDIFGAFLTGPIPSGGWYSDHDIAMVSINTINHLTNANLYIDNEDPVPGTYTQYDGYTVPLIVRAAVVPDTNYILKIAIGDVSDPIYDSGIFIKAHSFTSGEYIGIEKIDDEDLIIYPVPADHYLQIKSFSGQIIESISIADELGRIVLYQNIQSPHSAIDVSELGTGMYIVNLTTSHGSVMKKIIIQ